MTPALFLAVIPLVPIFSDPVARLLAADVGRALERAWISRQAASIDLGIPLNKLSDQLNGKLPFTTCWKFLVGLEDPDFTQEFLGLQAERVNAIVVTVPDLRALLTEVRALPAEVLAIVRQRRMIKAALSPARARNVS